MDTTTRTTTLVVSFSGTLHALCRGDVTADDLEGALFYFGATREYVIDDRGGYDMEVLIGENGVEQATRAYHTIRRAIRMAETDGRIIWRELSDGPTWYQLNLLLVSHDLPKVETDKIDFGDRMVAVRVVQAEVQKQQLPYRVIPNR